MPRCSRLLIQSHNLWRHDPLHIPDSSDSCPGLILLYSTRPTTCASGVQPISIHTEPQLTILASQETQRRVQASSRHDVLNATLSVRARETRSVPTCTVFSAVTLDLLRASHIPMPTSKRPLSGTRTLWYVPKVFLNLHEHNTDFCNSSNTSRTPRSTFPARKWHSVVLRRIRTGTI